jgi:predicted ester cyclase
MLRMGLPTPAGERDPKSVVRRMIDEVMNDGRLDAIEELYTREMAPGARRWIAPFRASFPDVQMEIVELIAEDEKVVGRFRCSGTHLGEWRGNPPTGRRYERVDEVYIFRVRDGRISEAWGIEDTRRESGTSGTHPVAEPLHRNRPSSVSTTSTPRSASRAKKPAKSEPAWSGSA